MQPTSPADPKTLQTPASPLRYLKGIGPKRAEALAKLGIFSARDLLYFFPRRYEDRSRFRKIESLQPGEHATIQGEILSVKIKRFRRIFLLEVLLGDDSGALPMVWFNQPYLKNTFKEGQHAIFFGKADFYQDRLQMNSPEYEIAEPGEENAAVHTGRITPVYPLTEGLFQRSLRQIMKDLTDRKPENMLDEYLPEPFRRRLDLMPLEDAVQEMHFPSSFELLAHARRRLVFDEFFFFELTLLGKMEKLKSKYRSHALQANGYLEEFQKPLPFRFTHGQSQACAEIFADLASEIPMNRMLQGDVGSGKTVVAAAALFLAARSGKQSAILVPTEILAEQHYKSLSELLTPLKVSIALLTSSTPKPKREKMLAELKQGRLSVLVGTHALLQEDVLFASLALIVIDEQHKFGVHQRCRLLERTPRPHQLVMTATPIPRTLALTVYGDLSVSTLRELPAGRKPIKTYWIDRKKQRQVLEHIRGKCEQGEQAYFIFPLIEESEKADLLAATKEYEALKKGAFSKLKVGLVHGRLSVEERDAVMKAFARNEIHVLVATSVIEVGVNVPNATMMVIENAERFGLAQLHQMRGRIGRGSKESECFLFGEPKTVEGQKRLRILTKTQDGFFIAEEDLKLRGSGDFFGTRQSGEPLFKVANPAEDEALLVEARKEAMVLVRERKLETDPEWAPVKKYLEQFPIRY